MEGTARMVARPQQAEFAPHAGDGRSGVARSRWRRSWSRVLWLGFVALWAMAEPVLGAVREEVPRARILRRALASDPGQEYFLYVPNAGGTRAPVFVAVHGISRNAEEHASFFAPYAEARSVVLVAPWFTGSRHEDYQRLGRKGERADLALDRMLAEVASLTGARIDKIYLFGFSGGAQFAHRYAMAHPEKVSRAVAGAAGWYTFPDPGTSYPYGLALAPGELRGVRFDSDAFLRVPIAVFVGGADVDDDNLRRNRRVDAQQGLTRVDRARHWVAAMSDAARARGLEPRAMLVQVPEIHHSFAEFMREGGLGERTFAFLFGGSAGAAESRASERVPAGGMR
jgi:poly(3-hydroxybutyrate) depolymerase